MHRGLGGTRESFAVLIAGEQRAELVGRALAVELGLLRERLVAVELAVLQRPGQFFEFRGRAFQRETLLHVERHQRGR